MKVVVTGGGGYVGYHVGWAIAQGGHNVILADLAQPDPEWRITAPKVLFDALPEGFWDADHEKDSGSLSYVKVNISKNYKDLIAIFEGATAVVHTASYGISGQEQLSAHMTQQEEVNVIGTKNILLAATAAKVKALVYTSTYNVVFGGQEIRDGDETLPSFPLHAQSDHYSRTKTIAETMVLMANGKSHALENQPESPRSPISIESLPFSNSLNYPSLPTTDCGSSRDSRSEESNNRRCFPSTLRTCALRLAGVMGLGERRHSRRVIDALRSGFLCTYGSKDNLVDFVGIQNVVQAHVKAMIALITEQDQNSYTLVKLYENSSNNEEETSNDTIIIKTPENNGHKTSDKVQVSGNAFFICDGSPQNHFEYFRPWYEDLKYGFPTVNLPLFLIMMVAHIQQMLYLIIYKVFPFKPFITPAEVYKSGITHYFSIKKAEKCFGYKPTRPNDQTQMVEYYKSKGYVQGQNTSSNNSTIVVSIIIAVLVYILYKIFI